MSEGDSQGDSQERKPIPEWIKQNLEASYPDANPDHKEDEARVNFSGGLNEFLDRAYEKPAYTTHVMESGNPEGGIISIEELLANVRVTKEQFGDRAYALLMNPADYANAEMLDRELSGRHFWEAPMENERLYFAGLLCQQAMFMAEKRYAILDKWAFNELLKANPEQL